MAAVRELIWSSALPSGPALLAYANRIAAEQLHAVRSRALPNCANWRTELARISRKLRPAPIRSADCNILKAFGDHDLCLSDHK
jgi:hypothetical protein